MWFVLSFVFNGKSSADFSSCSSSRNFFFLPVFFFWATLVEISSSFCWSDLSFFWTVVFIGTSKNLHLLGCLFSSRFVWLKFRLLWCRCNYCDISSVPLFRISSVYFLLWKYTHFRKKIWCTDDSTLMAGFLHKLLFHDNLRSRWLNCVKNVKHCTNEQPRRFKASESIVNMDGQNHTGCTNSILPNPLVHEFVPI